MEKAMESLARFQKVGLVSPFHLPLPRSRARGGQAGVDGSSPLGKEAFETRSSRGHCEKIGNYTLDSHTHKFRARKIVD
jgi:hypothetical protein